MNNKKSMQKAIIAVFVLLVLVTLYIIVGYKPQIYPLDFTKQQNVLREPAVFHLGEPVDVESIFENETTQDVIFTANIFWVLTTETELEPDYTDPIQIISVRLTPGCHYQVFNNNPPSKVVEITKKLFTEGHTKVRWRLTGQNIITVPQNGGSKEFTVDDFSYVPDEETLPTNAIVHDDKVRCKE